MMCGSYGIIDFISSPVGKGDLPPRRTAGVLTGIGSHPSGCWVLPQGAQGGPMGGSPTATGIEMGGDFDAPTDRWLKRLREMLLEAGHGHVGQIDTLKPQT